MISSGNQVEQLLSPPLAKKNDGNRLLQDCYKSIKNQIKAHKKQYFQEKQKYRQSLKKLGSIYNSNNNHQEKEILQKAHKKYKLQSHSEGKSLAAQFIQILMKLGKVIEMKYEVYLKRLQIIIMQNQKKNKQSKSNLQIIWYQNMVIGIQHFQVLMDCLHTQQFGEKYLDEIQQVQNILKQEIQQKYMQNNSKSNKLENKQLKQKLFTIQSMNYEESDIIDHKNKESDSSEEEEYDNYLEEDLVIQKKVSDNNDQEILQFSVINENLPVQDHQQEGFIMNIRKISEEEYEIGDDDHECDIGPDQSPQKKLSHDFQCKSLISPYKF